MQAPVIKVRFAYDTEMPGGRQHCGDAWEQGADRTLVSCRIRENPIGSCLKSGALEQEPFLDPGPAGEPWETLGGSVSTPDGTRRPK